jgi:hypothetical protein
VYGSREGLENGLFCCRGTQRNRLPKFRDVSAKVYYAAKSFFETPGSEHMISWDANAT